jgi:putative ABC transport system substrate-binding protein
MTVTIGRRELLAALGGAAASWPLSARAQQSAKLPTIGYLGTAAASAWAPWTAAFVQRLHELGWIDGRTVAIQYRWAEGRSERLAEIAASSSGSRSTSLSRVEMRPSRQNKRHRSSQSSSRL